MTNYSNSHYIGFMANYEVFAPNGVDIYPSNNSGGVAEIYGTVNPGDIVQLGLYINDSTNTVKMLLYDKTTGAHYSTSYSAFNATEFVGNPYSPSTNGFFTGLMTEWYNLEPTFGNQLEVIYSEYGDVREPAWLWIDEFYCRDGYACTSKQNIFYNSTSSPVYSAGPVVFASHGFAEEYAEYGEEFVTGITPIVAVNTTTQSTTISTTTSVSTTVVQANMHNSITLVFRPGWNLFSIPFQNYTIINNSCTSSDFSGPAWKLVGGNYQKTSSFVDGIGYWIKDSTPCNITISGTPVAASQFPLLSPGWNLIGSLPYSTQFSNISGNCNIIKGPFSFNSTTNSYNYSSEINPGLGYFVDVSSKCSLGSQTPPPPP